MVPKNLFMAALLALPGLSGAPVQAAYPAPVPGQSDMVVSAHALATRVGSDILAQGGNAVDAAVAVGYALAVVHPCCGNLGGGGFMTIHLADAKKSIVINFRERAPLAATKDMYLTKAGAVDESESLIGYRAVAVPGTVLGLDTALRTYGTMARAEVMAPAIVLAEKGFVLTSADTAILALGTEAFKSQPNVAKIFLDTGVPYRPGERLVQRDLARSLELIARDGANAFYKGPVAAAIVNASKANGGILSGEDFAQYRVAEMDPVRCSYRGYEVISTPPPSSGGATICLMLNILEGYPLSRLGFNSATTIHYMVEAMRRAFADRDALLGDPAFIDNPLKKMLSKGYADTLRGSIDPFRATPVDRFHSAAAPGEGKETTHISVADRFGNAVAMTYSINAYFGSGRIAGDTGFFLNDSMADFTAKPGVANMFGLVQGEANAIAPGKQPLSSISPTMVKKDGQVLLVLGSPGGSRIITIVVQGIVNVIDHNMDLSEAVNAPRIHNQELPDTIYYEPRAFTLDTARTLEEMGYSLTVRRPWGAIEAIMKVPPTGLPPGPTIGTFSDDTRQGDFRAPGVVYGASDSRRPQGLAKGN